MSCMAGKLIHAVFHADGHRWLSVADSSARVHAASAAGIALGYGGPPL